MNKKIIVCAFGPVGFGNLNQLLMMPQCSADDIFVYTFYDYSIDKKQTNVFEEQSIMDVNK